MENLRRVELTIDELEGTLDRISLVSEPAIETDFFYFSKIKENKVIKFSIDDEEKRVVTGVAMIPDMDILRFDEETKEYYNVFFSKETIYKCAELFFKSKDSSSNESNLEHQFMVDDVTVFESWIVDKENGKGGGKNFQNIPDGSWIVSYKIDNDEVWNNFIKTGIVKGFSVEGMFIQNSLSGIDSLPTYSSVSNEDLSFLNEAYVILNSNLSEEEIVSKLINLEK